MRRPSERPGRRTKACSNAAAKYTRKDGQSEVPVVFHVVANPEEHVPRGIHRRGGTCASACSSWGQGRRRDQAFAHRKRRAGGSCPVALRRRGPGCRPARRSGDPALRAPRQPFAAIGRTSRARRECVLITLETFITSRRNRCRVDRAGSAMTQEQPRPVGISNDAGDVRPPTGPDHADRLDPGSSKKLLVA
jgi:hypothetical protein